MENPDSRTVFANERCRMIKEIHKNLIAGYARDFGKYSGKINAQHIESVFLNAPRQLSKNQDGSVKRFAFKNVVEKNGATTTFEIRLPGWKNPN